MFACASNSFHPKVPQAWTSRVSPAAATAADAAVVAAEEGKGVAIIFAS